MLVFVQKTFLCLVSVAFSMVREKRSGRGGQGEDAWSESIELCHKEQTVVTNSIEIVTIKLALLQK